LGRRKPEKMKRKFWTQKEIDILQEIYPEVYSKEVARILNKNIHSVYNKAFALKLKKSDDFIKMKKIKEAETLRIHGEKHRFKKGAQAHNKGVPMPEHVKEKLKHTQFKKGSIPPNVKYDGHERIDVDGYVLFRLSPGKYVYKHRYIYEQVHGEIPKGLIIIFITGIMILVVFWFISKMQEEKKSSSRDQLIS
jgi:hypothetical protein